MRDETRLRWNTPCTGALAEDNPMRNLLVLVLVAGCAHKPETKTENKPVAPAAAAPATTTPTTSAGSCSNDLDCGEKQICIRGRCEDISSGLAECTQVRVHFPFNSAELDPAELTALQRSARCLKGDSSLHVSIQGNADERGTEEYNLALGDRRATAVAKYLESLGASQMQLGTVSYGKENPLCTEHDEACWAKNRRAELSAAEKTGKKKHH
jgi:peptidoglycan-associated lipoprotein